MSKNVISLLLFFSMLIGVISSAFAVTIESEEIRLGINGYINGHYTYMGKMAMSETETVPDSSTFGTAAHLLFNAVKNKLRVNLNLDFDNGAFARGLESDDEVIGALGIMETFGEYTVSEPFQVRIGNFLTPFGIYNQIRYITPLFAPVVLPMMYSPPENYKGKPLIPANVNLMLFGRYSTDITSIDYYLYGGNGEVNNFGNDKNKDKGLGGRVKLTLPYKLKIGGSYYTVKDDPDTEGREGLYGIDFDITVRDLNLQSEYAKDDAEEHEDRSAYYTRLTYSIGKFAPFVGYDYLKDKGDTLFDHGMHRYSVGTGYTVNNYITLKGEYHYHRIDDKEGLMDVPDDIQMFRTAAIFIF